MAARSAEAARIKAWSLEGDVLVSRAGNYASAQLSMLPDAIHVAVGPAGNRVIEILTIADGSRRTVTFASGTFNKWFIDGEHFLTSTGSTSWVYTSEATRIGAFALSSLENLNGQGSYLWTLRTSSAVLTLYRLDGGGAVAATYALGSGDRVVPAASNVLAIMPEGKSSVDVLELGTSVTRTTTPSRWRTSRPSPATATTSASATAAASSSTASTSPCPKLRWRSATAR